MLTDKSLGKVRPLGPSDILGPWAGGAAAAVIGRFAETWPLDAASFVPTMFYGASALMVLAGCGAAIFVARDWLRSRRT